MHCIQLCVYIYIKYFYLNYTITYFYFFISRPTKTLRCSYPPAMFHSPDCSPDSTEMILKKKAKTLRTSRI